MLAEAFFSVLLNINFSLLPCSYTSEQQSIYDASQSQLIDTFVKFHNHTAKLSRNYSTVLFCFVFFFPSSDNLFQLIKLTCSVRVVQVPSKQHPLVNCTLILVSGFHSLPAQFNQKRFQFLSCTRSLSLSLSSNPIGF